MTELAPPDRRIYFLHIPKTAGTSVASLVRNAYPQDQGIPAYFWHQLPDMDRRRLNGYRCYAGHFGTVLPDMLTGRIPTITMLRDPLEHFVSRAAHSLRSLDVISFPVAVLREQIRVATGDGDLSDAQADAVLAAARSGNIGPILGHPLLVRSGVDLQTRTLGVHVDLTWLRDQGRDQAYESILTAWAPGPASDAVYEAAVASLESMEVVGLVERMASSVALICRYIGVPEPPEVPLQNSNPARIDGHRSYRESGALTTVQITMIENLTQRDRELYERGCAIHAKQAKRAQRRWWRMLPWPVRSAQ
ncbi:MAG: hypothetical protein NT029_13370 [Armatimonadetes bacterium]|nr:hypothetical protein [Armatimonadota bacterium]